MPNSRYSSGCGLVRIRGSETAIIMAGSAYGPTLASSDLYLVESRKWVAGPQLPGGFCYGGAEATPDGAHFILVGGMTNEIWLLDTMAMEFQTMAGKLRTERNQFGTTFILDDDVC